MLASTLKSRLKANTSEIADEIRWRQIKFPHDPEMRLSSFKRTHTVWQSRSHRRPAGCMKQRISDDPMKSGICCWCVRVHKETLFGKSLNNANRDAFLPPVVNQFIIASRKQGNHACMKRRTRNDSRSNAVRMIQLSKKLFSVYSAAGFPAHCNPCRFHERYSNHWRIEWKSWIGSVLRRSISLDGHMTDTDAWWRACMQTSDAWS